MKRSFFISLASLLAFALWTLAVSFIDVQPVGPNGSSVGFAALNTLFHSLTGVHMTLYTITDWAGLVPVFISFGFGLLGLVQIIKRRGFFKADASLYVLGAFYVVVFGAYLLFESVVINYRPVLIDGFLEASYPSSTTLLVMTVIPTAIMQLRKRIKNKTVRCAVNGVLTVFAVLTAAGRTVSGVHWLTDIIGAVLLSAGLVSLYHALVTLWESMISARALAA